MSAAAGSADFRPPRLGPRLALATFGTVAVYAALIAAVTTRVAARGVPVAIALAVAFAAVQTAVIVLLLAGLASRRSWAVRRARREALLRTRADELIARVALGEDPRGELVLLAQIGGRGVSSYLGRSAHALRGEARRRLETAAREVGLAPLPRRPDDLTALAAEPLMSRAIAAEVLEPQAAEMAEAAIPRALASDDPEHVVVALDLLRAWRRTLRVDGMERLVAHHDARVRARAFEVLPYAAAGDEEAERWIARALEDPDGAVRREAALAAGKLRLTALRERLEAAVFDADREAALGAAFALGALDGGEASLQRVVMSRDRAAAAIAFEALEKATIGRLELG